MTKPNNLIPVRRPINGLTADSAAQVVYNSLIAQWGLTNSKKIGTALARKLKAEGKRRRGMK